MENFGNIIFLLAVLISLSALLEKSSVRIPQPILLVAAGLLIGFIPSLPDLALDPQIVFLIFLPPLLFDAASQTSWNEFKAALRPITALAISLVFCTTLVVAATVHWLIPSFGWAVAFVLGSIISPTDAVATTSIIRGMNLNKRVITIIEGESLANDASALIAYRYALAAVLTGSFAFWDAGLQFLLVACGGILAGIVIGYILVSVHKKINDHSLVETGLSLLTPYIAYLAAEKMHVSGILSVVTAGLVISWRSPEVFSYQTRMHTRALWDTIIFLLNGFVFILIGLQLPGILRQVRAFTTGELVFYGLIISLMTILVRIIWVFAGAYWTTVFRRRGNHSDAEAVSWKHVVVIAWTGTRGVLSLAAAMALPFVLNDGSPFPQRHLILFLSFVVIFVTLVIQGITLPLLIRVLRLKPDVSENREKKELQLHIANSVLHFIDTDMQTKIDDDIREQLKQAFDTRAARLSREIKLHRRKEAAEDTSPVTPLLTPLLSARQEILNFERELLIRLHKNAAYGDTVIREVERELDIEDMRLNQHMPGTSAEKTTG
ncbi:Na+/H+ antiporter [Sediminibacterium soli]|uniref:Na+/H+ antiporter n=1 Tax=Sediminibacterium soli TaxID=2698829 RepID=UPI001379C106|nr:Na+/H+ antiporter [Sediminibacterium soli]NCI46316.1 Na+/H+ antiporter [Sediminibacterium soli]